MASLFASPDIVALVAAFPPPLPTRNQRSLVRSNSGNSLLNSRTVLDRFRTLLEIEPSSIRKSDLPHRLGIERIDWLLDCYEESTHIRWSRSGMWLIPQPEWINIIEHLTSRCQESLVEIRSFMKEWDIEPFTDRDINELVDSHHLESFAFAPKNSNSETYLSGGHFVEATRQGIKSAITGALDEKLNLSQLFPSIPGIVLKEWADAVATDGQVEFDLYDVVYLPSGFSSARAERTQAERETQLQSLLEAFEDDEYVQIDTVHQPPDTNHAVELCRRYTGLHTNVETPTILDLDNNSKVVIFPSLLDRTLEQLKRNATNLISNSSTLSSDFSDGEIKLSLISESSKPTLAEIVLKVPSCAEQVASAIREANQEKEQKRHDRFGLDFRREVFAPAQLYAAGIDSIIDPKLRQSLSEYVATYLEHEVIPPLVKSVREDSVLSKDKGRMREIEKFVERSGQAKDCGELLTVMGKFAKKAKISLPSEEEQRFVRKQTLERKVSREMPKLSRGSDILQNLVWVLLAAATESESGYPLETTAVNGHATTPSEPSNSAPSSGRLTLFMSPGKDTGRIIKQYAAMARDDGETSEKLAVWREKLKAGSQTEGDLADMQLLAESVVRKTFAVERTNAES